MHDAAIIEKAFDLLPDDIQDDPTTAKKLAMLKEVAASIVEEIDGLVHVRVPDLNLNLGNGVDLPGEMRKLETYYIRSALVRTGGHQTNAAQLLGIKLTTLHQKLKKLGISARQVIREESLARAAPST